MSARYSWKGQVRLSLVTVAVKAYPANNAKGDIHFHQLHEVCHSRIQYHKTCPQHGAVPSEDIVSAYEYAKDRYVVVDAAELDKLRTEADKAIHIRAFLAADVLDPMYAKGKTYYLLPDGPLAGQAYAVLHQGMLDEKCHALAQVVLFGKEQLVWLRPLHNLLVMSVLYYHAEITPPQTWVDDMPARQVAAEELRLVKMLIATCRPASFDLAGYRNEYTEKLGRLIEAKVSGQEIVATRAAAPIEVCNLMEALRQSLNQHPVPKENGHTGASSDRKPRSRSKTKAAAGRGRRL